MGEEKERKGGERKKEEGAGTDERPGKSGRGERNKERREKKRRSPLHCANSSGRADGPSAPVSPGAQSAGFKQSRSLVTVAGLS